MSTEALTLTLRIAQKRPVATDIEFFELRSAHGGELPPFTAGAHVSLRIPNGEIRKYSLCNDPADGDRYCIAVKRETGGRGGSTNLIEASNVGDEIAASEPRNDFELAPAQQYIFIAGGIGVTPILSMIRHIRSTGEGKFKLYYLSRSPETTAFLDELKAPEYHGMVTIHHDDGDPEKALDLWPVLEKPGMAHLYCCGPRGLMQAVRDMTGHWSSARVHFEDFTPAGAMTKPDDAPFTIRLARSGDVYDVPVGRTILEVLREHGRDMPSSCESGTCGTCRTKLIAGDVDHRDLALADYEKADHIMICVSRARSGELTLDL